jgi:leucyl-tRNA synthetase
VKVDCPKCGGGAERETDTLDTYIDSSWYMYRYFDPKNNNEIFDQKVVKKWEPIDFYNGADHATAHLLYARFIARFFKKIGLVENEEPFKHFLFNGKVTASDGTMFSKSKGNGVDPLEIIESGYGADALRTYLMFAAPLELWIKWDPQGVPGTFRFLTRLWNLVQEYLEADNKKIGKNTDRQLLRTTHKTIKKMSEDIEHNRYNTAIAAAMSALNDLYKLKDSSLAKNESWRTALSSLVALVAPFAPHVADELWAQLGNNSSIQKDSWPTHDEKYIEEDEINIVVQINGKVRANVLVANGSKKDEIIDTAKKDEKISSLLEGKEIKKEVYVDNKLVNFVI